MSNINYARKELIDALISSLSEDKIPWRKEWSDNIIEAPYNLTTGTKYNGENVFILYIKSLAKEYNDPRWCTFNQVAENKWRVNKGEKATKISFYCIYDTVDKKNITFSEYERIIKDDPTRKNDFEPKTTVHNVYNAKQMTGIPTLERSENKENNDIEINDYIKNIVKNINVQYVEAGDKAFYSWASDTINMPEKKLFVSDIAYNSTLLHELAHSTMHETRLNRKEDLVGEMNSPLYAKEELRAEISSMFLSAELGFDVINNTIDNHKAYIQSWINVLNNEPDELFKAIAESNKISSYLIDNADIEKEKTIIKESVLYDEFDAIKRINKNLIKDDGSIKSFQEQLLEYEYGIYQKSAPLIVVNDSTCLENIIIKEIDSPITINQSVIEKIKTKHEVGLDILLNIDDLIRNNTLIMDSKTEDSSIVAIVDEKDKKDKYIVFAIKLNESHHNLQVNKIKSVYGKNNLENLINSTYEQDLKIYPNKKTEQWAKSIGLQLPKGIADVLSNNYDMPFIQKSQVQDQNTEMIVNSSYNNKASYSANKKYTDEEKKELQGISIADYARSVLNMKLEQFGRGYLKMVEFENNQYSSVIINLKKNTWRRYVDGNNLARGDILNFVQYWGKCTFNQALNKLDAHKNGLPHIEFNNVPKKNLEESLPDKDNNYNVIKDFLINERQIDERIIQHWIAKGHLYQSQKFKECVFTGKFKNKIAFSTKVSTKKNEDGKYGKFDVAGSIKEVGIYHDNNSNKLMVFEASLDAMAYQSLELLNGRNPFDKNYLIVSGATFAERVFNFNLEHHGSSINSIVLSLDNDKAGFDAMQSMKKIISNNEQFSNKICIGKLSLTKDWNNDLRLFKSDRLKYDEMIEEKKFSKRNIINQSNDTKEQFLKEKKSAFLSSEREL